MKRINPNKINPCIIMAMAGLVVACSDGPTGNHPGQPQRPNIILLMADDLGLETIGTYGGTEYSTPNIDRLADEGMKFTQAHSTPLCTPTRVQLMTGKYNFRNYIGFGLLDPEEKTFGHLFQNAGYKTCIAGKWQLYGRPYQRERAGGREGSFPGPAGFDEWCLWQITERKSRYRDPWLDTSADSLKQYTGEYGPDIFTSFIEQFMEENRDSSFFIYFPMCLVHDPFQPTPDNENFSTFEISMNDTSYFDDMMIYMDKIVGRIAQKTEELGLSENTVIIFTGDNGTDRDVVSNHVSGRIRGAKGTTIEYGTHVPFIVRWPRHVEAGSEYPHLMDFTDILPTLTDLAGFEIPGDFTTDGYSFYKQLMGDTSRIREWIFCHYYPHWGKFKNTRYVFNEEWKLYENGRFFNIKEDILETTPLKNAHLDAEARNVKQSFRKILDGMR